MDKAELRRDLRRRRGEFVSGESMAEMLVLNLQVAEQIAPHLPAASVMAAYVSDGDEVDPMPILFRALDCGVDIALPRAVPGGGGLTFHHWLPGDDLVPGPGRTVQPRADAPRRTPDLILAPLVGFDRRLNRLGMGAGYYDRAFAELPDARRIGLAWSIQEVSALPTDRWDVPLHGIATEREWIGA